MLTGALVNIDLNVFLSAMAGMIVGLSLVVVCTAITYGLVKRLSPTTVILTGLGLALLAIAFLIAMIGP